MLTTAINLSAVVVFTLLFPSSSQQEKLSFWDFVIKYVVPLSALSLSLYNFFKNIYDHRFCVEIEIRKCVYFPRSDHLGTIMLVNVDVTNKSKEAVVVKGISIAGHNKAAMRVELPSAFHEMILPLKYKDGSLETLGKQLTFPLMIPASNLEYGEVVFLYLPHNWNDDMAMEFKFEFIKKSIIKKSIVKNASNLTGDEYLSI